MPDTRLLVYVAVIVHCTISVSAADEQQEKYFETEVRPLLAAHCFECHGEKKQQGELRLDRRKFIFEENAAGVAVVPNNLKKSRLWEVIQYDEFDTQMPPSGKLPPEKIEILKKWIESGAYWPEEAHAEEADREGGIPLKADGTIDFEKAIQAHWAYQPVKEPKTPAGKIVDKYSSTIDKFLAAKLVEKGLTFSEPTKKSKLIRRLSFDLRGLPPTFEEVQQFENNPSASAYQDVIDRYLADPAYGQRWGRYWLDIARYADTKGYVFTENRLYPYSYTYRDYVIDAFNSDKPYDTFIMEQMAADQLGYAENDPRLAALGFLTIGPRFLNRTPDIIDDRIDVVTRGLMGMTLGCARCHDHKFDPLPTADYYSLYGVFNSTYEPDLPPLRGDLDTNAPGYAEFAAELAKREKELSDYKQKAHQDLLGKARGQLEDYFPAAVKALGFLPKELDLKFKHGTPRDKLIQHWKTTLERMANSQNPVFIPSARILTLKGEELAPQIPQILDELSNNPEIPKLLIERLRNPSVKTKKDVVDAYTTALVEAREEWKKLKAEQPDATQLPNSEREQIRRVLFGAGSLSDLAPGDYSPLFERDNRDKIRGIEKKIDNWHATSPNAPPRSMVLLDKEKPVTPVIFVRGNPGRRGDRIPRRGPQILNPAEDAVFKQTSGRKEFAEQIVTKQNPLTARVIVNRIWGYHFGTPLVETTTDFGIRTKAPVHRQLLDYLAWSLMHQHNWSLKGLHKEILLSKAWQQSSADRPQTRTIDSENQLYWKQNRQRLDFEAMRDSMLTVSGKIDLSSGGRPVDIEKQPFPNRRTVYAFIDRNNPSGLLRTFDFPTPNSSSPGRSETTVPQQALFSMNSKFAEEMATALSQRVSQQATTPQEQAQKITEIVYARKATEEETKLIENYLTKFSLKELSQALLLSNEFMFVD